MARSPRNTQKRNTRRMFRSKAIALCNKHGIFFDNTPRDSVLIEHCLKFFPMQRRPNQVIKMELLQAMGAITIVPTPKVAAPKKMKARVKTNFYESREWREVRYKALVKNNGKCECCGAGKHNGKILHVDHILPRSLFPARELDITNLQVLCEDCNLGKSNKDVTDWRERAG